jgi:GNAT superfamily N-acetyltransferase
MAGDGRISTRYGAIDGDNGSVNLAVYHPKDALMPLPRRLSCADDMTPTHALLVSAFAYMDGVIDPPSSLSRMTPADLAEQATRAEVWVIGASPDACVILTPQADTLYLGKLAVAHGARGRGLARALVDHACMRARALALPSVTLQTRVELVQNHLTFARLGFVEAGRRAHPGFARPTSVTFCRWV